MAGGDKYAAAAQRWITDPAGGPPVVVREDWTSGETPNHCEQRLAAWAGQHLPSVRDLILFWYGENLRAVGMDAKGGTDEAIFSTSHWGHFGAARGPLLLFALRSGDKEVAEAIANVWRMSLAAAILLATPAWRIVSPGARHTGPKDGADQRTETNATFQWLGTGKLARRPKVLDTAPSWLGLSALLKIEAASKAGEPWARPWPEMLAWIRSAEPKRDLPPLKNQLVVERSKAGHVAHFETTNKMGGPADWACAEYSKGKAGESYGFPAGSTPPPCPGGPGEIFRFPVAGSKRGAAPGGAKVEVLGA
jgi:hypothetical protein